MRNGLADSIDEATKLLKDMRIRSQITVAQQCHHRMLPPRAGCPLCLDPNVERPVALCLWSAHSLCKPCADSRQLCVCPMCPGEQDPKENSVLWPDGT